MILEMCTFLVFIDSGLKEDHPFTFVKYSSNPLLLSLKMPLFKYLECHSQEISKIKSIDVIHLFVPTLEIGRKDSS